MELTGCVCEKEKKKEKERKNRGGTGILKNGLIGLWRLQGESEGGYLGKSCGSNTELVCGKNSLEFY